MAETYQFFKHTILANVFLSDRIMFVFFSS